MWRRLLDRIIPPAAVAWPRLTRDWLADPGTVTRW